jgi:hypothetical protein
MLDTYNLVSKIPEKKMKLKIYSLLFVNSSGNPGVMILKQKAAYSQDEAEQKSRKEIEEEGNSREQVNTLFVIVSASSEWGELVSEYGRVAIEDTEINKIIKQIIKNNDHILFEKNKKRFTSSEIKYIKSKL